MSITRNAIKNPLGDNQLSLGGFFYTAGLAALIFAVYFLFSLFVPYIGDDYMLQVDWMTANGGERLFSWEGLWRFAAYMRETDNARLCNVMFGGMCLAFPKWVLAVVIGVSATVIMWAAALLVNPAKRVLPYVLMAVWTWVTFTFSWRGGVMGVDNSFNALLPSAVTLVFLLVIRTAAGYMSLPVVVAGCMYALFAGAIHEGYSVPVCCGLGVWCLIRRLQMSWRWWVMALCYVCGSLYVISAPGIWARLGYESDPAGSIINIKTLISMSMGVIACVASVSAVGFAVLIKSGPKAVGGWFCEKPMRAVVGVAFVVSLAVALKTGIMNSRAVWICDLFAAVFMFQVLAPVFVKWPRRVIAGLSGVAFVLVVVFYVNVVRVQIGIYDEEALITELMAESEYGTVYRGYDISLPKTTLLHPVKGHWRNGLHVTSYDSYMSDGKLYAVVPEALLTLTDEMVEYIEGKDVGHPVSSDPDVWPQAVGDATGIFAYGGVLLRKDGKREYMHWTGKKSELPAWNETYNFYCDDGRRFDGMPTVALRFKTLSGRCLIYMEPCYVKVTGPYEKISATE